MTEFIGAPDPRKLVSEAREALGLFDGALPDSPAAVWHDTLEQMKLARRALEAAAAMVSSGCIFCHRDELRRRLSLVHPDIIHGR